MSCLLVSLWATTLTLVIVIYCWTFTSNRTLTLARLAVQYIRVVAFLITYALTPLGIKPIVHGTRFQSACALTVLFIQYIATLTLPVADALATTIVQAL